MSLALQNHAFHDAKAWVLHRNMQAFATQNNANCNAKQCILHSKSMHFG